MFLQHFNSGVVFLRFKNFWHFRRMLSHYYAILSHRRLTAFIAIFSARIYHPTKCVIVTEIRFPPHGHAHTHTHEHTHTHSGVVFGVNACLRSNDSLLVAPPLRHILINSTSAIPRIIKALRLPLDAALVAHLSSPSAPKSRCTLIRWGT